MAEGFIPRSKIRDYGVEEFGLQGDDLDFFVSVVRRVDGGYLSNDTDIGKTGSHVREDVAVGNVAGVKRLIFRLGATASSGGKDRFRKYRKAAHA